MTSRLIIIACIAAAALALAACGPSYTGRFVDPSGTAVVQIRADGVAIGGMGQKMRYTVTGTGDAGTTLKVTNDPPDAWSAEWRVSKDGKELHGASSPAPVVFRRQERVEPGRHSHA